MPFQSFSPDFMPRVAAAPALKNSLSINFFHIKIFVFDAFLMTTIHLKLTIAKAAEYL
ncbi:hypothetical protein [Pontibacter qinzhouensis]|uniref:hypothetical protein n=1 Tax=Pontibacter qinzhouensis TaxID=2603253 RepID=UPI00164F9FFA|nr:hypothetical protein [Pontibacter qinzhouensis]